MSWDPPLSLPRFATGLVRSVAFSLLAHYTYKLVFPFHLDTEADFSPRRHSGISTRWLAVPWW
jgi:hypothetical protein